MLGLTLREEFLQPNPPDPLRFEASQPTPRFLRFNKRGTHPRR